MARSITFHALAEKVMRAPGETERCPDDLTEAVGPAGTEEPRARHPVSIPIAALLGLRSYSPPSSSGSWEVAISQPGGTAAAPAGRPRRQVSPGRTLLGWLPSWRWAGALRR